ncbi:MAG: 3-hydroxyisobutyrate dehydrogenase [Geminicoccaceae bacterium]|nr:3-hydroxyisobutyrate dehydrogenase [Geminicoccaceae bacterium]
MSRVAFIGLGNMGLPMAVNLARAGHAVRGFDMSADSMERATVGGIEAASGIGAAVENAEFVITMLPAGQHVRAVYLGTDGILDRVTGKPQLIDCSTIDVETARDVAARASERGLPILDAPVSGGVGGAEAGTLTFMVGGSDEAFARARDILDVMGKAVIHAGAEGNGQAAKICNNMILGISMIAVSEAFVLAENLGLSADKLFEISSQSSGQCWSMTAYCPVPGPVPSSPANRDYRPGFTAAMMLKDLKLACEAAQAADSAAPLGAEACRMYELFARQGNERMDFSGIVRMIRGMQ